VGFAEGREGRRDAKGIAEPSGKSLRSEDLSYMSTGAAEDEKHVQRRGGAVERQGD